jgi:hypothetical protein
MQLETINKLFLELSQVTTAKTARELALEAELKDANEALRSAHSVAKRRGEATNWSAWEVRLEKILKHQHPLIFNRG